ncbi:MAG: hypothetical protein LBP62_03475 [Clostridiales bacterium]|jgi:hypothetical protein|nr:hypothetical protein [Clostridiales bacterium]
MKRQYSEAEKKENKRLLGGLLFAVGFCIISIAVGFGVFFGYCRPFDNRWVEYECVVWNTEIFEVDTNTVRVVYYVDGVRYENFLYVNNDEGGIGKAVFFYNKDNPNEIISAVRKPLMIIMPIVAIFGAALFTWYVVYYVKEKRKSKNI